MQNLGKLTEGKVQIYMYIKVSGLSTLDLILQEKSTFKQLLRPRFQQCDSLAYHLQHLQLWR